MNKINFVIFLLFIITYAFIQCSSPSIEIDQTQNNEIACVFLAYNGLNNDDFVAGYIVKLFDPGKYDPSVLPLIFNADIYVNEIPMDTVFIDSLNFAGSFLNRANFQLKNLHIAPNDSILLSIYLNNRNEIITGKTVVPEPITNIKISENQDYFFFNLENANPLNSYEYVIFEKMFDDTVRTLSGFVGSTNKIAILKENLFKPNSSFRLGIISYDRNLTEHKINKKDPSGLSGHYGVFFSLSYSLFEIKRPENMIQKL